MLLLENSQLGLNAFCSLFVELRIVKCKIQLELRITFFFFLLEMSTNQHICLAPLLTQWTVQCLEGMAHEIAEFCFH